MRKSLVFLWIAHSHLRSQKTAIRSKKSKRNVFFVRVLQFFLNKFFLAKDSLIPSEQCERIAQVAQDKWATVNDSLRSFRINEQSWVNRSGRSPKMSKWANRSFFSQKTSDSLRKPMSKFPALHMYILYIHTYSPCKVDRFWAFRVFRLEYFCFSTVFHVVQKQFQKRSASPSGIKKTQKKLKCVHSLKHFFSPQNVAII